MKFALVSIALSTTLLTSAYGTGLDVLVNDVGINYILPHNHPESVAVYIYEVDLNVFRQFQYYLDPTRQKNHVLVLPHKTLGFVLIVNKQYSGDSEIMLSKLPFSNTTGIP